MGSIIALLVIAAVSMLLVRTGATALTMTGLSRDAATFQACSAFFGVGFTTREAEMVVNHPVRRRIVLHLIIVGNIGLAGALAALMLTFIGGANAGPQGTQPDQTFRVLMVVGVLLAVATLTWVGPVRRGIDRVIAWTLSQSGAMQALDYDLLLRVEAGYCISELEIVAGHWLIGKTLREAQLLERGVLVLGVERDDGTFVGAPGPDLRIESEDVLTMYGQEQAIHLVAQEINDSADSGQAPPPIGV